MVARTIFWTKTENGKVQILLRKHRKTQRKEPLSPTPLPDRPWQRLGVDLCEYKGKNYIVLSDYYSRFLEIHLSNTTAEQVVIKLKATFARFGIPEVVVSDNGPQFTSETFRSFSHEFDFVHVTSSPHHPSSNGHAERAVQSAKAILRQKDPVLALQSYRTTPHASTGVSPAEILMSRRLRNTLPTLERNLSPKWPDQRLIRRRDDAAKQQHAFYFNRRHGARNLPLLRPGDSVLVKLDEGKRWRIPATVVGQSATERSLLRDQ